MPLVSVMKVLRKSPNLNVRIDLDRYAAISKFIIHIKFLCPIIRTFYNKRHAWEDAYFTQGSGIIERLPRGRIHEHS